MAELPWKWYCQKKAYYQKTPNRSAPDESRNLLKALAGQTVQPSSSYYNAGALRMLPSCFNPHKNTYHEFLKHNRLVVNRQGSGSKEFQNRKQGPTKTPARDSKSAMMNRYAAYGLNNQLPLSERISELYTSNIKQRPDIEEIFGPIMGGTGFPQKFLRDVLQPCIPSEKAGILVAGILLCAEKEKGTVRVEEFWRESGLKWADVFGRFFETRRFLQNNKLEFTIGQTTKKDSQLNIMGMTMNEIKRDLLSLHEEYEIYRAIRDWFDTNISDNDKPTFIRILVSAVIKNAISGSPGPMCKLDKHQLQKRINLLNRYIAHDENLELQALYATQSVMNKMHHPNGLLYQIFEILYDESVISAETFIKWESNSDPKEAVGKDLAIYSVRSFLLWFREVESSEESDYLDF